MDFNSDLIVLAFGFGWCMINNTVVTCKASLLYERWNINVLIIATLLFCLFSPYIILIVITCIKG